MDNTFTTTPQVSDTPLRSCNAIYWILGIPAVFGFHCCGGLLLVAAYIGTVGPGTSAYTGNRAPSRNMR